MPQYDDVAERYEKRVAPKYLPIARIVADHAPDLAGKDAFEVGAGTGIERPTSAFILSEALPSSLQLTSPGGPA